MRFALTAEQSDLHGVVADLLDDLCGPGVVRAGAGSKEAGVLFAALVELGAPGLLVDEDHGGLGLDESAVVPMLIEAGRAAAPLSLTDTFAVAPGPLAAAGRLPDLVAGTVHVVADPAGTSIVRYGTRADVLLQGGWAGSGVIRVVDLTDARREPVAAVDPVADLHRVSGGTVIAEVDDPGTVRTAWLRGVLGSSAELIGLSRRMLDMTVAHVTQRRQFGVPIGSFQAIKHHLASALIQLEFAAPAVAVAGVALARGEDPVAVDREVSTAKALASDAAAHVARITMQCHGAIAYTTEYDWHLFAKRAWALTADRGSADWHRSAVARSLGLEDGSTVSGRTRLEGEQ